MDKELTLSSKNSYNNNTENGRKQTVLPVRFISYGKRTKQNTNHRRGREPYPLWWNLLNSAVLQKTAVENTFAKEDSISSTSKLLSSYRFNHRSNLFHNSWHKSVEQDKDATAKRRVSKNSWNQKLSLRKQLTKISETLRSKDHGRHQQNSRPVAVKDILSSATTHKYPLRFRFNSSNDLRQTDRRSQDRIQSRQKRKTLLSPVSMLRVLHQGLLARSSKAWGCIHRCRCSRIFEGMHPENSTLYLPHQGTGRFWLFRSQIHRTFRRKRHWLCDSGKTYQWHKEKTFGLALPPLQERLVSCRVPVYTDELEKNPSLHCDSQKASRQTTRATNFVYTGTLFIPNTRYEHSFRSSQYLVFLQRPCFYRNSYQRTQTRFLFNQDTNKQFFSESGLFYLTSFGLQYNQLVQATLFAGTIEKCNTGYNPFRNFSISGKIDKIRKQEYPQASSGTVSVKSVTELYNPEDRKVKDHLILADLLNSQKHVPSEHYKNLTFSRFF